MNLLLRLFLLFAGITAQAQPISGADSLEALLPGAGYDKQTEILYRLSGLYQPVDIGKSIDYDLRNLELQREAGDIGEQSNVLNNLGISHYMIGDYGAALDYFEQSLKLRQQFHDTANIVKTLNNLGVISQIAGDFDQALAYLRRSLIFKMQLNDTLSTAKTLNNIGVIYKDVGKLTDAQRFLTQALQRYRWVNDSSGIAAALNNLGQVAEGMDKIDSALIYFENSLEIKRQIGDRRGLANTLNNIGLIYGNQGKTDEALKHFTEAMVIRRQLNDNFGLASVMNNMANLYLTMGENRKALELFRNSLMISRSENLLGVTLRNYAGISGYFEKTGRSDSALFYHKLYASLKDTIFNQDLKQEIVDLKNRYETEKGKKEIEILRQKNEIQQLQIENDRKQKIQYVTVIFLLFFGSVTMVLYMQYRNNRNLNKQLRSMNAELEARVKIRTAELEEANATRDRFFSIIAHDLKNPFNSLLGFTEILDNDYTELGDYKRREISRYLRESAESVYRLLENLLEWSSAQTGRLQINAQRIDLEKLAVESMEQIRLTAARKGVSLKLETTGTVLAVADEDMLRTVFRNLLSNAVKFTSRSGNVAISAAYRTDKKKKWAVVSIADTGTGIRPEEIKRIFHLTENKPTKGTDNEPGTGLGLPLSYEFIRLNGGSLHVESTWGKGSRFYFMLPAAATDS